MILAINPVDLSVNLKNKRGTYVPKKVRLAQERIAKSVALAVATYNWMAYVVPDQDWQVHLLYGFRYRRSDLDNPIKRTLDAIVYGLHAAGYPEVNDNRVRFLTASKLAGCNPLLGIHFAPWYDDAGPLMWNGSLTTE